MDNPTPKLPKDVAPTTPNAYTYKKNDTHIIPVEEILEEEKVVVNINTQKPVGGVNDYTKDVCTPEEVVISGKTKEYGIIDSQLEFNFDVVKPEIIVEEPLDDKLVENKKRKAVIPTGDVKRAEIPEVKDVQSRGFSVNIPKNNNSIGRVDNNKGSGIYYKRDKN